MEMLSCPFIRHAHTIRSPKINCRTAHPDTVGEGYRVIRGREWSIYSRYCRSSTKFGNRPERIDNRIGFRVVRNYWMRDVGVILPHSQ